MKMRITGGKPAKVGAHRKEAIVTAAGRSKQRVLSQKAKDRLSVKKPEKLPLLVAPFSWAETISGERTEELHQLMSLPEI